MATSRTRIENEISAAQRDPQPQPFLFLRVWILEGPLKLFLFASSWASHRFGTVCCLRFGVAWDGDVVICSRYPPVLELLVQLVPRPFSNHISSPPQKGIEDHDQNVSKKNFQYLQGPASAAHKVKDEIPMKLFSDGKSKGNGDESMNKRKDSEEFLALKSHHFSTSLKNYVSSKQLLIWQAISKYPSYTPQHNPIVSSISSTAHIFHGSDPPFKRSATERTPSSKNPSSTLSPTKRSHSGGW
jgi:hypothetical protein